MKKLLLIAAFFFYNFTIGQSIVSVTPNNANRGQALVVNITGEDVDFVSVSPTLNVHFIDQFSNILPVTSMIYPYGLEGNNMEFYLEVPGQAIPGLYDVNVFDSEGTFNITLNDGFTVNNQYTYSIRGNVRLDSNGNGCDASDPPVPNQKINFTNGPNTGTFIADNSGFYNYYNITSGSNSFTPVLENLPYYTVSPPSATVNITSGNPTFTQDFCITPNGTHNDLQVTLIPLTLSRPGFDTYYKITYKNVGTHPQSGSVNFTYFPAVQDLISTTPVHDSQQPDPLVSFMSVLGWNFTNLAPFESRHITVRVNLNTPEETPPLNAGNRLISIATITGATDETPENNTSELDETIVGSLDPNDKTCVEGDHLDIQEIGKYLNYVIRFENTGTANAEFVVIRDVIDTSKFEIGTLMPTSSSHPFTTRIKNGNIVEFVFENINLAFDDANNDGYVAFKIKTKSTLPLGTNISNTADIFFDYNPAVTTNTYSTLVFTPLNTGDFEFGNIFTLSPVPAKNNLSITTKQQVEIRSVNIYNTLGQLVQTVNNPTENVNVSGLKSGSYIIKITSDKGTASSQFIKE